MPLCSILTKESAQHKLLSAHHCRKSSPAQSLILIPKGPLVPSAKSRWRPKPICELWSPPIINHSWLMDVVTCSTSSLLYISIVSSPYCHRSWYPATRRKGATVTDVTLSPQHFFWPSSIDLCFQAPLSSMADFVEFITSAELRPSPSQITPGVSAVMSFPEAVECKTPQFASVVDLHRHFLQVPS